MTSIEHGAVASTSSQQTLGECDLTSVSSVEHTSSFAPISTDNCYIVPTKASFDETVQSTASVVNTKPSVIVSSIATDFTAVPYYTTTPVGKTKSRTKSYPSSAAFTLRKSAPAQPSVKVSAGEAGTALVQATSSSTSGSSATLPPAASLGIPRAWSGSFQNHETTYHILPQVTSLATPSAPLFFNPSTVLNWQLSFPTASGQLPTVSALTPTISLSRPSHGVWNPAFVTVTSSTPASAINSWSHVPTLVTAPSSSSPQPVQTLGVNSEGIFQVKPGSVSVARIDTPKESSGSTFIVAPATLSDLPTDINIMGKTASSTADVVDGKATKRTYTKKKKTVVDDTETTVVVPPTTYTKPSTSRSASSTRPETEETMEEGATTTKKTTAKKKTSMKATKTTSTSNTGRRGKVMARLEFVDGEKLEASDAVTNTWYKSKLVEVDHDGCRVKVHFEGWNGRYDEWLPKNSKRLRPLTEEIFSEHQESYSVGDFVIARWQAKHTQAGLVVGCLSEKKYVVLFHDGSQKTVTIKGLRRMSPMLGEKHAVDLERLTQLKKTHPSLHSEQSDTETEQAEEVADELSSTYTFDEVDGVTTEQSEPATAELASDIPSTSGMASVSKKTGKKPGRPPAIPGASPPELLITSASKPKRQPKKPIKFNDSIETVGKKKRRKKSDAQDANVFGIQTAEGVEAIPTEVEKEPVLVLHPSAFSAPRKEITILHASPIKLSKDEAQNSSLVIAADPRHSTRTSLERVSLPKSDVSLPKDKSELVVLSVVVPAKKATAKTRKKAAEAETAEEMIVEPERVVEKKIEKKSEKKIASTSHSLPARRSLVKELVFDDEVTSDQIEAAVISSVLSTVKKPRKKQKLEVEVVEEKKVEEVPPVPSTSAVVEEPPVKVKKRSGRPKTIKNLIEPASEEGEWVTEEAPRKTKRPKILAPKELIIRLDHNEFKCNVGECQKSFRKQQLLDCHLKHYHQLPGSSNTGENEEEKNVETAAVNRKKKTSTSSVPDGDDGAATLGMLLSVLQPALPEPVKSPKVVHVSPAVTPMPPPKSPVKEMVKEASPPKSPERRSPKKLHDVLQSPAKPSIPEVEEKAVVEEKMVLVVSEDSQEKNDEVQEDALPPKKKKRTKREKSLGHHVEEKTSKKKSSGGRRQSFKKQKTSSRDRESLSMEAAFNLMGVTPDVGTKGKSQSSRSKVRRNELREDSETEEVNQYIQNDHELVHCSCGYEMENGFMIQCELCATWQHGHCYGIELESEVPKHYVCDFCRAPKSVRFSQRHACHDLQFLRAGRLPVFTPLDEDEPVNPQNKELYQTLTSDTLHCNDQIRALRKVSRSLIAAQEAHTKNGLFLTSICKTHADKVKLGNALKNIPEAALENLNLEELLEKLVVNNGGELMEENVLDGTDISLPSINANGLPPDFSPGIDYSAVTQGLSTASSGYFLDKTLKDPLKFTQVPSELSHFGSLQAESSLAASVSSEDVAEADQSLNISEPDEDVCMKEVMGSPEKPSAEGFCSTKDLSGLCLSGVFAQNVQSTHDRISSEQLQNQPSTSRLEVPVDPPTVERVESPEIAVIPPRLINGRSTFKSLLNGLPGDMSEPQSPEVFPFTPPSWSHHLGAELPEGQEEEARLNTSSSTERSFEIPLPDMNAAPLPPPPAFVMSDIDPDVMALCSEGNLPAILKAVNNREDALEKYLDELEAHMLELEKNCDDKYGTKFATTPQDAEKDCAELQKKLNSYQTDLRNLERLGSVIPVKPEEPTPREMPGPLPVPTPPTSSRTNVTVNDILRPPLPMVIKLNKDGKPRKNAAGLKTSPTTPTVKRVKESGMSKLAGKSTSNRSESPQSPVPSTKATSEVM